MVTDRPPYELVERNLRHAMAFYSRSHPSGELREMPGVSAVSCGWNYPVFNSALLSSAVPGADGEMTARLAMATIFFRSVGHGWSFWACQDLLDARSQRELRATCQTYGLDPVLVAPGMFAEELRAPVRSSPRLEIREVIDGSSRLTFAHLISTIFDLPFELTMHIYGPAECWTPEYAGFIGYVGERPVTVTMVNATDHCCGFYSVGTVPGQRRRGYAETVMRHAHAQMRLRYPFRGCVLQSSTVGRRLYEQMGFREVTRFSVFRSTSI